MLKVLKIVSVGIGVVAIVLTINSVVNMTHYAATGKVPETPINKAYKQLHE